MTTVLNKPDIVAVIESEAGTRLKGKGNSLWTVCPFHSEKTASLKVNPERQSFYCFGCREHGDSIDFVRKLKGLSFLDALRYLGIENDKPYRPNPEAQKKRERLERFRVWEREYFDEVSSFYRAINAFKLQAKTMDEVERAAELYKQESVWEHHLDILSQKSDEEKIELYKGAERWKTKRV